MAADEIDVFISYSHTTDSALSPGLQTAMQRLGRVWYRGRALRVFRDQTDLPAADDLGREIRIALERARYFLLLASPEAARSTWVGNEVDHWMRHRERGTFLIAITDGAAVWDDEAGDFEWSATNALPARLAGYFVEEPLWVDLRRHRYTKPDLRDAVFKDAVATLAAPIHGMDKRALIKYDGRQHRYVVAALGLFLIAALVASLGFVVQRKAASDERDLSTTRQLIDQSRQLAGSNPDLARLLAVAAVDLDVASERANAGAALRAAVVNRALRVLPAHKDAVTAVAYSQDGTTLATGSMDKTARLWDAATGSPRGEPLTGHPDYVAAIAFSPDNTTLVTASKDGLVRGWEVSSGRKRFELSTAHEAIASLAFSADGAILATGDGSNGSVRLWEIATGAQRGETIAAHKNSVKDVHFVDNDATVVTVGFDDTVKLWDVATGQSRSGPAPGSIGTAWTAEFSRDGTTVAVGHGAGLVVLSNATSGRTLREISTGVTGLLASTALDPRATRIATGGAEDGSVQLWDTKSGERLGEPLTGHTGMVVSMSFDRDGAVLATGGRDGSVRLWDTATGQPRGVPLAGHSGTILAVGVNQDGVVATGGVDRTARLWDGRSGLPRGEPLIGHTGQIWSVAFTPDGTTLATAGADEGAVRLWNVVSGTQRGVPLTGQLGRVGAVAISPDGATLASGGGFDGTIQLWDIATATPRGEALTGHRGPITALAFSPDSSTLASGGVDGTIRFWDPASGQPTLGPLESDEGSVWSVAYSPDGTTLAGANETGTIRLWATRTGDPVGGPFVGHNKPVRSVAYSRDGETIASGGEDGHVRLWDARTGAPRGAPLTGHAKDGFLNTVASIHAVAFSADGLTLVSGGDDSTALLWDVAAYSGNPIDTACRQAGRDLTDDERAKYLPSQEELDVCRQR
ncbi:toll/interleukin-1 receptor domain-containing protein [Nocardia asteroides]|uniref:toll/interleukin-1 receptor domain-containing protein n=1 Tax=Nocardia asteroides TaxID=1824 RepID=UPI00364822ED